MTRDRLAGLDALRGIAALCVVIFHARPQWLVNGYLSVDLFFMLSGYVMARSFEPRFAQGMTTGQFMRTRYWRLWPVLAIGALLCLPLFVGQYGAGLWPVALANLLLIPIPVLGHTFLLNGPAWSIFFELLANALHAKVLWRLARVRIALMVAAMLVALVGVAALSQQSLEVGMRAESFLAGVPRVLLSYGIGILLWRTWRDVPPFRVPPWFALTALPAYYIANSLQGGSRWPIDLLFVVMVCPLVIAGGLGMTKVHGWAALLGAISFPLYAVHAAVLQTAEKLSWPVMAGISAALLLAGVLTQADSALRQWLKARRRLVSPA